MDDSVIDLHTEREARALLTAAGATIYADPESATDVLDWVHRRSRRRTRSLTLVAAGMTTAAAAGTVLTLTTSAAEPALAATLTNAAAKTSTETYHARMSTTATQVSPGSKYSWHERMLITGEFDPAHGAYAEQVKRFSGWSGDAAARPAIFATRMRFVHGRGYYYSPVLHEWIRGDMQLGGDLPVPSNASTSQSPDQQLNLEEADPRTLLAILKSTATVRSEGPVSGPGWTGTRYWFTAAGSAFGYPHVRATVSGTVDVDQQGLVRHMTANFLTGPASAARPAGDGHAAAPSWRITENATFSDFGAPVSISPPPNSHALHRS